MKGIPDRVRKKIKNNSGMTVFELLCAVLILLLVSSGMASAVSLGVRQYQKSIRDSEAKVLYSTLMTVLSNELAYTTDIRVDAVDGSGKGNVLQFQSQNYVIEGNLSTLMTDESGDKGYGQILLGNSKNTSENMRVLGKAAYANGLLAKVTSITYDNSNCCFSVYLSIGYQGTECYGGEFQVQNVNRTLAVVLAE